ncbi:hypothetical protein A6A04_09545 [Paramagnetospirillum marisnigri]|uniref:Uncharacterized protein n=1 Tax=Paramagnetospirillum marisnigri TaxID=1285242 RepID=A0A178M5S3_9PROT|nr:hypothetical protein A6A04_09545 [Paramagnetospirillum marisnigri]
MESSYRAVTLVLAALAAAAFAYPLWRIGAGFEIDYNEGWNAFLQSIAARGESPYTTPGPLFFNNYPPLSFYLVGVLGSLLGDPLLVGRALSALAVATISLSCGVVTRAGGGDRTDAVFAAATCLGLFCAFATDYVGVNDPQLLAQGLLCLGFAIYVGGPATPARLVLVAVLFALGLLTKHNVLALPLVVTIHALWQSPPKARLAFLGATLALMALALAVILAAFGTDFFHRLLASRIYDPTRGFLLSMEMLGHLQIPLAASLLFMVLVPRQSAAKSMVGAYLALGLLIGFGFASGAGVDINIYFDTLIGSAMGCGLLLAWIRRQTALPRQSALAAALLVNFGVLLIAPQTFGRIVVDALGDYSERERLFAEDVAYLSGLPGPAICESMLLCLKAGKGVWIDPYNLLQASLTGRLPADQLVGMLRRHEVAVLQMISQREHPLHEAPGQQVIPPRFVNFGDDVHDELDLSYRVARVGLTGRFYLPKASPPPVP